MCDVEVADVETDKVKVEGDRTRQRRRYLLTGAAGVVLLAAIIFGISALSQPAEDGGMTPPDLALSEDQSSDLFDSAMEALDRDDVPAAIALLQRALVVDPSNRAARVELERLLEGSGSGGSGATPTGDDGSPPGNTPQGEDTPPSGTSPSPGDDTPPPPGSIDDDGFTRPVDDLRDLLPARVTGYELGLPLVLGDDASVAGDPVDGGPVGRITRVLFAVHDRGSAEAAEAFISDVMKVSFPENPETVTVDGVEAYFGTDGTRFASTAYRRGRYVFEVVVTGSGVSPASLKDDTVMAARAFPDAIR